MYFLHKPHPCYLQPSLVLLLRITFPSFPKQMPHLEQILRLVTKPSKQTKQQQKKSHYLNQFSFTFLLLLHLCCPLAVSSFTIQELFLVYIIHSLCSSLTDWLVLRKLTKAEISLYVISPVTLYHHLLWYYYAFMTNNIYVCDRQKREGGSLAQYPADSSTLSHSLLHFAKCP